MFGLMNRDPRKDLFNVTNPSELSYFRGGASEQLSACSSSGPSSTVNSNSSSPVKNTYPNQSNISSVKPGPLPANLDDLKVGRDGIKF